MKMKILDHLRNLIENTQDVEKKATLQRALETLENSPMNTAYPQIKPQPQITKEN